MAGNFELVVPFQSRLDARFASVYKSQLRLSAGLVSGLDTERVRVMFDPKKNHIRIMPVDKDSEDSFGLRGKGSRLNCVRSIEHQFSIDFSKFKSKLYARREEGSDAFILIMEPEEEGR